MIGRELQRQEKTFRHRKSVVCLHQRQGTVGRRGRRLSMGVGSRPKTLVTPMSSYHHHDPTAAAATAACKGNPVS